MALHARSWPFLLGLSLPPVEDGCVQALRALVAASGKASFNVALTVAFVKALKRRKIPHTMPLVGQGDASRPISLALPPGHVGHVELELLSPTKQLARRLQAKLTLPAGSLLMAHALNSVTTPNRASYVFRFQVGRAVALFTGDSGFVDFYGGRGKGYIPERLEKLRDVGLLKVPHHAGHFEHFARALRALHLASNRTKTKPRKAVLPQFFVTSHGRGHLNPSAEFEALARDLIGTATKSRTVVPQFDFTNPPVATRFDLVCPACPRPPFSGPHFLEYRSLANGQWLRATTPSTCCDQ